MIRIGREHKPVSAPACVRRDSKYAPFLRSMLRKLPRHTQMITRFPYLLQRKLIRRSNQLPDRIARFFPFRFPASPCMPPSILAASTVPPPPSSADVAAAPDDTQPGLPSRILLVLLTRPLEAFERLPGVLATADVRIVGGRILIIHEADWASAEKAARASEDVSILNGKASAKGEGEDEETITPEIGENGHLIVDDVVAVSAVAESFEGNDKESQDDGEPHLFRLSLIDFAHTTRNWTRTRHGRDAWYRHSSDSFTSDRVLAKH
ncbi:hypothetical protein EDD15DRAFT_1015606 [Pisolithus albus]|nr:hypothetical protein EDD15DRAFT_1015606 [Pisolithus albus]